MRHKGYSVSLKAAPMRVFADLRSWENREELAMDIFMPQAVLPTQLQGRRNKDGTWGFLPNPSNIFYDSVTTDRPQ